MAHLSSLLLCDLRDLARAGLLLCFVGGCSSSAATGASSHDADISPRLDAYISLHLDAAADVSLHLDAKPSSPDGSVDAGPRANGTLGTWSSLAPMPLPRANHCAVAASGYLVVIGGNYEPDGGSGFVDIDTVNVAPIQGDGSLGAWTQAGTTPSPVSGCTATASGDTIYLVDGIYDDTSDQGQVVSAQLSTGGVLGSWTNLGPLPNGQDAFSTAAWIGSDSAKTLYVMDSATSVTATLHVPTFPTFGTWVEDDWLPGFLGRPEYAFTGNYVYAMGGYLSTDAGNPSVTAVNGAPVASGGTVGAPFSTTSLPTDVTFGNGVAVDDWIFVIGGKTGLFTSGVAGTYSASVGANGTLGAWQAQTSLPEGRTDMAVTLAGDFLYLTGGGYMGPGVATVYAARVRF
jgi:hypothetical protein